MSTATFPLLSLNRHRMATDGEGVTTLVAGAGCPLHCKWCINKKILQEGTPQFVTAEELFERVKVDNLYFMASGGGITFGGGESLLYADFIREFGICVRPSGRSPPRRASLFPETIWQRRRTRWICLLLTART